MVYNNRHFISVFVFRVILLPSLIGNYIFMVEGIIGRDLVLTPKQGLQLNGKSIFYEEQSSSSKRAWENALKHVTYLTLFTDASKAATIDGNNISQLRDYREFLQSPYIIAKTTVSGGQGYGQRYDSQFGDIVTLASGRLEELVTNHSFRFIESSGSNIKTGRPLSSACFNENCKENIRIWAFWQVQKIRHHDVMTLDVNDGRSGGSIASSPLAKRKYRYELKFSVTPLKSSSSSTSNDHHQHHGTTQHKRKVNESFNSQAIRWQQQQRRPQNFIQKEDDYPQSFGRIAYNDKRDWNTLAERRFDGGAASGGGSVVAPVPQSTFMHGIFQAPPPPLMPSSLTKLNIGEYLKGPINNLNNDFVPTPEFPLPPTKATPKIELLPNIFNLGNFLTPTTFRPSYQMKFPRPEIYHHQQQEQHHQHEFPTRYHSTNGLVIDGSNGNNGGTGSGSGTVTHHFHHHFYMPPPASSLVGGGSGSGSSEEFYQSHHHQTQTHESVVTTTIAPSSYYSYTTTKTSTRPEQEQQKHLFPTSSSREHGTSNDDDDVTDDGYSTLLVEVTPKPTLPFIHQSQFYEEQMMNTYQVSKRPSLLIYAGSEDKSEEDKEKEASPKPFIQSEPIEEQTSRYSEPDPLYHHVQQNEHGSAQLESPPHIGLTSLDLTYQQNEQEQSKNAEQFSTSSPSLSTPTRSSQKRHGQLTTLIAPNNNNKTISSAIDFVSTSTTISPLRALSRYKGPASTGTATAATTQTSSISSKRSSTISSSSTTTTEIPILSTTNKWKLRLDNNNTVNSTSSSSSSSAHDDAKAKDSSRHESKIRMSLPRIKKMSFKRFTPVAATASKIPTAIAAAKTSTSSITTTTTTTTIKPLSNQQEQNHLLLQSNDANEIYEVLTQKSVSKSVSIKIGDNGEEIPIIIEDDNDNVIKNNTIIEQKEGKGSSIKKESENITITDA